MVLGGRLMNYEFGARYLGLDAALLELSLPQHGILLRDVLHPA
jgi:hypothetical protein